MHVAFIVTAHVPYVRRAGRAPIGEDELHALIAQSLMPLVGFLHDLAALGQTAQMTMALSPLLLEQLADPVVQKHFVLWMEQQIDQRNADFQRFEEELDGQGSYLARFYLEWNREALRNFEDRYSRNLVAELRELRAANVIEVLAGAATNAYLPLLGHEESVRAQIEQGVLYTMRSLGHAQGVWLPGCGWRTGLDAIIADVGMRYVIADPSDAVAAHTTQPHWLPPHQLVAFFPHEAISQHVWSAEVGYRGDLLYRDPTDPSGYQAIGLMAAQPYDPYHAFQRSEEHAEHFVALLADYAQHAEADEIVLIPLDAKLLGQVWFEGLRWFQAVLRACNAHDKIVVTTPGHYLRTNRPRRRTTLATGSWGKPTHETWQSPRSAAYWQALRAAEARLVMVVHQFPQASGDQEQLLNQAARELLLAQDSHWPTLLAATVPPNEPVSRWRTYLLRFHQLCDLAQQTTLQDDDRVWLEQLQELDGPFTSLNYRIFDG